jgi:hypothetical protein
MNIKALLSILAGAGLLLASGAQAYMLTPGTCVIDGTCWASDVNSQPDADAIELLTGASVDLTLFYKSNVGGSDEGPYAGSYDTTYSDSASDPMDALIEYISGATISCPTCYLSVKDGNHSPALYVFNISDWNGMLSIDIQDFWPDKGAISNVAIWGASRVPEPATLALFAIGLLAVAAMKRKVNLS